VIWQASFTGQSNFGNPTGWDVIDGFSTWNVYQTHGNPSYGLIRSFTTGQSDSIKSPASDPITVPSTASLSADIRVMQFNSYPSSSATLPASAEFAIKATDGLTTSTIISMTAANQNTDTNWVTLTGNLSAFAGSQIRLIVVGKNGADVPADDYFIDVDNITVTHEGSIGFIPATTELFSLYPNPAVTSVQLNGITGTTMVSVIDIFGKQVSIQRLNLQNSGSFDVSELAAGSYFLMIENNGKRLFGRFVKG
jgi:hypothetical protein